LPDGCLDAQLDCLVVWKSPIAMTLLLAELMLAAGPRLAGVPDFLAGQVGLASRLSLSPSLSRPFSCIFDSERAPLS
jgi:hypothetical protein